MSRAKIPQQFSGYTGDAGERVDPLSRTIQSFNSAMQSRRMRASLFLPTLPSLLPPSSLEERFGVTRPRSGFGSVSRRVSYRVHCVRRILGGNTSQGGNIEDGPGDDYRMSRLYEIFPRRDAIYLLISSLPRIQ